MNNNSSIPVTIISGFLGSGKTTLLNRIMNAESTQKIAVMVNDLGQIIIDSQMIVNNDGKVLKLANGCICCSIADDLIGQLESLLRGDEQPDYIIIEASGVSDPGRIARTLNYPQFRQRIQLDAILTLIDAGQILNLDSEFKQVAMTQLEAADIVIINKTDQCSDKELARIKDQWLFPDSRVYETVYSKVPLPLIIATHSRLNENDSGTHCGSDCSHQHEHESDHSTLFDQLSWHTQQPIRLSELRELIENLPVDIYRAKGVFLTQEMPDKPAVLQQVGSRVDWSVGSPDLDIDGSSLLLIARKGRFDRTALLKKLNSLPPVTENNK